MITCPTDDYYRDDIQPPQPMGYQLAEDSHLADHGPSWVPETCERCDHRPGPYDDLSFEIESDEWLCDQCWKVVFGG